MVLVSMLVTVGVYWFTVHQAEAGVRNYRWGAITLSVSDESGVRVARDVVPAELNPPSGGPIIVLSLGHERSRLVLDALTGQVIDDFVKAEDRPVFDAILATAAVNAALTRPTGWPYEGDPPLGERESWYGITYLAPDPSSGLVVFRVEAYGADPSLLLTDGSSKMRVNARTGEIDERGTSITEEERAAFNEFYLRLESPRVQ
jgi:hypothetical protein